MLVAEKAGPDRIGFVGVAAAALLVFAGFAKWRGLIYPNYLTGAALQVMVLVLAVYWAFAKALGISIARSPGTADVLLGVYALYAAATCLWSDNTRLAAIGSLLVLFPVFWARGLGRMLRGACDRRLLLRAFFIAGTVAAAVGIGYVRVRGRLADIEFVLGHRNFLAMFLLPPLLICAADLFAPLLAPGAKRGCVLRWPLWVTDAGGVVMLVGIGLCRSVGAGLGVAAGIACLIGMRLRSAQRRLLLASAAALAALALFVVSTPRVMNTLLERTPSQATRWFLWEGTARMIGDRPLLGWGTGTFPLHFADYKPTGPMRYGILQTKTLYPHNELLLVAVEGGIVGLALYLAAFFLIVRRHLRTAERSEEPPARLVHWAIFAGFAAMFAQGLVSIALRYWGPATAFWTLAGLMLASGTKKREAGLRPVREPIMFGAARIVLTLVLVVFLFVAIVSQGWKAERLIGRARKEKGLPFETRAALYAEGERASRYVPDGLLAMELRGGVFAKTGRIPEAIATYGRLNRLAPGYGFVRRALGSAYHRYAERVGPSEPQKGERYLREAIAYLEEAVKQYPYDPAARMAMARALRLASGRNIPTALDHLRVAAEAEPKNAEIPFLTARFLAETGRMREALVELDRAKKLCRAEQGALRESIKRLRTRVEAYGEEQEG